jgi:hypothetical protein
VALTRRRVLIGFAEALAAPEVAASLLGAGYEVVAFSREGVCPALRHRHDVRVVEVPPPEHDVAAALGALAKLPGDLGLDAVMPLDDVSLLLCDRVLAGSDVVVVGPRGPLAQLALDKRRQMEAATAAGLHVPEWCEVDLEAGPPPGWEYPFVVKPIAAVEEGTGGLRRLSPRPIHSDREMAEVAVAWGPLTPAVCQRWVHGVGQGVFGLSEQSGVALLSAHHRIRMMNPAGSGSSACRATPVPPDVTAPIDALLRAAGWHGLFMVELLRDRDGTLWFMELNGRAWGSMALARRAGFEYPAWAVAEAVDGVAPPTEVPPFRDVTCRHLGRELVHLLFVLRGPRGEAPRSSWPGRWATVRDLARRSPNTYWYNWSPDAKGVFVADTWRTVVDQVRG